jgi:uncharacterized membrane protein YdjX (TVP38/TMEM64 family)
VTGRLRSLGRALVARRGDARWDLMIRGTGVVALAGIPCAILRPDSLPAVWFTLVALAVNGPFSPVLPTAFEPLIMEAATWMPILAVTLIGTAVSLYAEYLNYHLYAWVLRRKRFAGFGDKGWMRRSVRWFERAPFTTTVVFAFTPLPFWFARILSIYARGNLRLFMLGTAIGRLPRIFIYAWLGSVLEVPAVVLAAVGIGTAVLVIAVRLARGRSVLAEPPLADEAPASPARSEPLAPGCAPYGEHGA